MAKGLGNFTGAFADCAILFPFIGLLSIQTGFSLTLLLGSVGAVYIISGLYFGIPMPVQPLKSLAATAIAIGASMAEVRLGGACVGLIFLVLVGFNIERYFLKIPTEVIHGLQLGLGIILMMKALSLLWGQALFSTSNALMFFVLVFVIVAVTEKKLFPILGLLAFACFMWAIFYPAQNTIIFESIEATSASLIRVEVLLALVVPQLILTSANSIIATRNTALRYFGPQKANKTTIHALATSIGLGNVGMGLMGGLPFCHGSGGLTAHVKGGSTHFSSNLIIGFTLVVLSMFSFVGQLGEIHMSPFFLSVLLFSVGFFHCLLAKPSFQKNTSVKIRLVSMGCAALITQNMLWILGIGLISDLVQLFKSRILVRQNIQRL